jgi:protein-disulfide isomerase
MLHPKAACAQTARKLSTTRRALLLAIPGIVLLGLAGCGGDAETPAAVENAETFAQFASIPQRGISLGRMDAPLTLTVFVDLRCHYCRDFALTVEPALIERYARSGKARLVLRTLAFLGPASERAARMAGAMALQDHLWQFTSLLFASSKDPESRDMTDSFLRRLASEIPLVDVERAMAERASPAVTAQLEAAQQEADRFGIRAVPSFLVGKTGETPRVLQVAGLTPEAFTGPIDALLHQR